MIAFTVKSGRRGAVFFNWFLVATLAVVSLILRVSTDIDGALDIDTINFGLSALDFDVLQHRPHPPGYPGYVLFLKLIHFLIPAMGPLDIAKWGSRLCGTLLVLTAFWTAITVIRYMENQDSIQWDEAGGLSRIDIRPFFVAIFAAFSPLLWYYSADGQSHAADALLTVLIFGLAVKARSRTGRSHLLLCALIFGLSGSIRPTIVFLGFPLVLWAHLGRPWKDWLLSGLMVCGVTLVWYSLLIHFAGGWAIYRRANDALLMLFYHNFCIFGKNTSVTKLLVNLNISLWNLLVALIPLFVLQRNPGDSLSRDKSGYHHWLIPVAVTMVVNILFYSVVYIAEGGYYAAVAALACLAPLTWKKHQSAWNRIRIGMVTAACPLIFLTAPPYIPFLGVHGGLGMRVPGLNLMVEQEAGQRAYISHVCELAQDRQAILITDDIVVAHLRLLAVTCPNVRVGILVYRHPLIPALDSWMIYHGPDLLSHPSPVPWEIGIPGPLLIADPVDYVIIGTDARKLFAAAILGESLCPPIKGLVGSEKEQWPHHAIVFETRCLPEIKISHNPLLLHSTHKN